MSLFLATSVVTSMFNGFSFRVNAQGNGDDPDSGSNTAATSLETEEADSDLVFPDGTPVNTNSVDFDPGIDYSSYGYGYEEDASYIKQSARKLNNVLSINSFNLNNYDKAELPSSVDLSSSKYFPEIGDQEQVGSCCCWANVYYAFTYEYCKANDLEASKENIMSPAFIYNQAKTTCDSNDSACTCNCDEGGTDESRVFALLDTEGTPTMEHVDFQSYSNEYANRSWFPDENIWKEASTHRSNGFRKFNISGQITDNKDKDLEQIKSYLAEGKVLTFHTRMDNTVNSTIPEASVHAGEKIRIETDYKATDKGHQMTIVGYDDDIFVDINANGKIEDSERGAFKIANSWGKSYGNDGFIWVAYDSLNKESACGRKTKDGVKREGTFKDIVALNDIKKGNPTSGVYLVVDMTTASRNTNMVVVFAKDKKTQKEYSGIVKAFQVSNNLAASLDGKKERNRGQFCYDLNNIVSDITADKVDDYEWSLILLDRKKDSNITVFHDIYIENDGNRIIGLRDKDLEIDNKQERVVFSEYDNEVVWDIEGNESDTGLERIVKAICKKDGKDVEDVSYRFSFTFEGEEKIIRDFSSDNTLRWTPEKKGVYVITVDYKIGDYITSDEAVFFINEIQVKNFKYNEEKCYANKKNIIAFSISGGTGKTVLNDFFIKSSDGEEIHPKKVVDGYEFLPKKAGEYTAYVNASDSFGDKTIEAGKIVIKEELPLEITRLTSDIKGEIGAGDAVSVKCAATGGSGEYSFSFGLIYDGKERKADYYQNIAASWPDYTSCNVYLYLDRLYNKQEDEKLNIGKNTIFVDVTDKVTKKTVRGYLEDIVVAELAVRKFNPLTEAKEYSVGDEINLYAELNSNSGITGIDFYYSTDYGNTYTRINQYKLYSAQTSFVPEKAGNYIFKIVAENEFGQTAEATTEVNVVSKKKKAVIYYNNPNFAKAYIHYSVNGTWTAAPGIEMKASDKDGYNFMFEIPVDAEVAENADIRVCFNDGNNNWDNANGKNYSLLVGEYGIKNGKVNKLNKKLVIYLDKKNWEKANIHYAIDGKEWTVSPGIEMKKSDRPEYSFMYEIELNEAEGANVCFNNGNGQWDSRNGANYHFAEGTYLVINGNVIVLEN